MSLGSMWRVLNYISVLCVFASVQYCYIPEYFFLSGMCISVCFEPRLIVRCYLMFSHASRAHCKDSAFLGCLGASDMTRRALFHLLSFLVSPLLC